MPQRLAIYPGSFDPLTNGHIDVLERALSLFDKVLLAVASGTGKTPLFSVKERVQLARESTVQFSRAEVVSFDGLLVDFARQCSACAVVRGLRAVGDFEFEFQLALMNRQLAPGFETVFLFPKPGLMAISSTLVKEIARFNGDVSPFVPSPVAKALKSHFQQGILA